MEEKQSEGDMAVSNAMLRDRWTPSAILPPEPISVPRPKDPSGDTMANDMDPAEMDEPVEQMEDDSVRDAELVEGSDDMEVDSNHEESAVRRPHRSARSTAATAFTFSDMGELDREKIARENKKKSDELHKKSLSIACCGMLLALRRRDPLLLFAEPATAEGYLTVVQNPIDLGMIRRDVLGEKYSSLGAFVSEDKLLCENAVSFNPA